MIKPIFFTIYHRTKKLQEYEKKKYENQYEYQIFKKVRSIDLMNISTHITYITYKIDYEFGADT